MSPSLTVDVQIACDDGGIPTREDIQEWLEEAIRQSGQSAASNSEVAVRIVDADEIRTLNHLYRKQDKATNVLSFPTGDIAGLPKGTVRSLGDIVICASVVAAEANKQGKQLADHWGHMLVHGALHLLGFDHETDAEAADMEAIESRVLASRNVADPYEGS